MKWLVLIGRSGSALLALGLAFALLSIIPPAPSGGGGGPGWSLIYPDHVSASSYGSFTPRTGFHLSLSSNSSSIQFYILSKYSHLWHPKPPELEAYLQEHTDEILFSGTVDPELSLDFFPPRVTEVWFVYSNPSTMLANVTESFRYETVLVSKEQVLMPAVMLIVSGVLLALPWTFERWRRHR
jgi:hypothetical protein